MLLTLIVGVGTISIITLHILTGVREYKVDNKESEKANDWIRVGLISDIKDKRAITVQNGNDRVAVFRNGRKISAVSNYCRHQGGPLSEGKIVKGCITCPWHGYQYYPHNGCSPPPFTEKIETYNLKLLGEEIFMDPDPNEEGTDVDPLVIPKK